MRELQPGGVARTNLPAPVGRGGGIPELGIPYEIVTPKGTLTFNEFTLNDYFRLESVRGMDAASVRALVQPLAQADGARVGDAYRGALTPVFAGVIPYSTETLRRQNKDKLSSWLQSILRADGTLKWTPTGTTQRQRTCRLFDGPDLPGDAGQILYAFQFTLICQDPLAYSITEQTSGNISVNGAAVNVTNGGDVATWPKLRIYGAVTDPILKNNTTTKQVKLVGTIADGDYIEVDTNPLRRSVLLDDGTVKVAMYDAATSEMFPLEPGVNAIECDGTSPGGNAKLVVYHRDAFTG